MWNPLLTTDLDKSTKASESLGCEVRNSKKNPLKTNVNIYYIGMNIKIALQ